MLEQAPKENRKVQWFCSAGGENCGESDLQVSRVFAQLSSGAGDTLCAVTRSQSHEDGDSEQPRAGGAASLCRELGSN